MRTGITHLFIPGPTNVPERVRQAINVAQQDMRAPDFKDLTLPLFAGLKKVLKTQEGTVFIIPGSGTGAWEAAITNTLSEGDRVLMARHGQFSLLWAQMAGRLGLDVDLVDIDWGKPTPVETFAQKLEADKDRKIKAVFVTHNETATGVTSDVAGVRAALDATGHPALLFVDGVSSIGSIEFRMDDWGVDLAVTGSQKGLMLPAGLGILGASQKAMEAHKSARLRRAYFEFDDHLATYANGQFPYTPPTPLLHGLGASLDLLFEEGLENVFARHHRLAEGVRRGVAAWGLKLWAEDPATVSDTVSTIRMPEGKDARDVISAAYQHYRTSLGSGLGPVAGKGFRIGHIGDCNEVMCLTALAAAEISMHHAGVSVPLGAGVAAAQAWYSEALSIGGQLAAE